MAEESKILGPDSRPCEYIERDKEHLLEFFAYETVGCADVNIGNLDRRLREKDDADPYRGGNGKRLEHCGCKGVTSVEVLEFLKGLLYDNLIVAWLYSLRPSVIRMSYGEVCCDLFRDRVTVWLNTDDTVQKITQEVTVGYGSRWPASEGRSRSQLRPWSATRRGLPGWTSRKHFWEVAMKRPVSKPCTAEKIYTENEEEFLWAVQAYKDRYRVKFPSLSELFYIMRQLGYRMIAEREEI